MKSIFTILGVLLCGAVTAQDYPHYTMFMYNKLVYNPGYAGSRNALSINGTFRNQWTGIAGAPINYNLTIDAPIGSYTKEFRSVALGFTANKESQGPVTNTSFGAMYAYRIRLKNSIVSFGLKAGVSLYSADYSDLKLVDQNDEMLTHDIKNALLPNFGAGVYWSSKRYYLGLSVPDLLENYFDKAQAAFPSGKKARQIRSSFISGGYSFPVSDHIILLPQMMGRYSSDSKYNLPFNADINLTAIIYQRIMIGATYRTDKSVEGMVHVQVAKKLNIGYSYDYSMSDISRYAQGSHEITLGFDFVHDLNEYADPRFIKDF